jgi:hypothetical protein
MGQGFMLQVNNAAPFAVGFSTGTPVNFTGVARLNTTLVIGQSTGLLYYEVASGVGILPVDFAISLIVNRFAPVGRMYLHFDSTATTEFPGYIYIAGFTRAETGDAKNLYIYPYIIQNQVFGDHTWPFGNVTFVMVSNPTLPEYPFPPT